MGSEGWIRGLLSRQSGCYEGHSTTPAHTHTGLQGQFYYQLFLPSATIIRNSDTDRLSILDYLSPITVETIPKFLLLSHPRTFKYGAPF